MNSYATAFEKLKHDYASAVVTTDTLNYYSPIKKVCVLDSVHGIPAVTLTNMHGIALDGYTVDKTILVNDEQCSTDDDILLKDAQSHFARRFHNVGLTRLRCGLMTCVALEEAMKLMKLPKLSRVGFIGNGKTNIQNAECIHELFKVSDIVIRGSARNRSKNMEAFYRFADKVLVDDTEDLSYLNECDAVISCTSTCDPADQISTKLLSKPRIMIALDTGYLFDESFRKECENFADDVPQIYAYYDEEFIFDKEKTPMKQLMRDKTIEKNRICVYMFGISFADAEVAEMVYRHEVATDPKLI